MDEITKRTEEECEYCHYFEGCDRTVAECFRRVEEWKKKVEEECGQVS